MLFLALYRVFKSVESLYFDIHAEPYVVRRSPTLPKVLGPSRPGIEPENFRTASARSSHFATGAPYIYLFILFYLFIY